MPAPRALTLADAMSLSRLALAGAFVIARGVEARLAVIAVAGLTDYLDGWIARRRKETSAFGALIDVVADRVFVLIVISTLVVEDRLSIAACIILLGRDIVTTIGALSSRVVPGLRRMPLQSRMSGKVVTALQFVALLAILVYPSTTRAVLGVVATATVISIIDYTLVAWRARLPAATSPAR